jgi:hypothetical protein
MMASKFVVGEIQKVLVGATSETPDAPVSGGAIEQETKSRIVNLPEGVIKDILVVVQFGIRSAGQVAMFSPNNFAIRSAILSFVSLSRTGQQIVQR